MTAVRSGYRLTDDPPLLDEYVEMRRVAGLSSVTPAQGEPALVASWAWVTIRSEDTGALAAMGRVLGDGGWYFHVADMATHPGHQRRGLGRAVLTRLVDRIYAEAPPGPYVSLLADEPGRPLYRSLGFAETGPGAVGMQLTRS